jgi:hypothetical protein
MAHMAKFRIKGEENTKIGKRGLSFLLLGTKTAGGRLER